mmetsp:Transcript_28995/g.45077  ORF Transcript_28995/g.45077 Transcript_28995/m.45077 type:complete len:210 (+) Transcript_28995:274-903(+)
MQRQVPWTTDQNGDQQYAHQRLIDPLEIYRAENMPFTNFRDASNVIITDTRKSSSDRTFGEARYEMKRQIISYLQEMLTVARSPAIQKQERLHALGGIIENRIYEDNAHSLEAYHRCGNRKKWRRYINDILHQVRARRKIEASSIMKNRHHNRSTMVGPVPISTNESYNMRNDGPPSSSVDAFRRSSVASIGNFCNDLLLGCSNEDSEK